jgi:AcrR family transcriptional regulator
VNRQSRAGNTRRQILSTAALAMDERGFLGTTMTELIARSGLSASTVYAHFPTKESLAIAVIQQQYAQWPPLIEAFRSAGAPAVDTMVALSFEVARMFKEDVAVRAGVRLSIERSAINAPLPAPFLGWMEVVEEFVATAQREGTVPRTLAADAASRVLVCAFFGIQHVAAMLSARADIESRMAEMWRLVLPGLTPGSDPATVIARARRLRRRVRPDRPAGEAPLDKP